jgi:GNAT superfamily N-acetyltransferase
MRVSDIRIEQWDDSNERWAQLVELLEREDQLRWILPEDGPLRADAHVFVALEADAVVGFLAFIVQEIGPPDGCPPLGLTEAKVLAFGVREDRRRSGIGRALQLRLLERATELGCYQARSVTGVDRVANLRLKLALGFAVSPTIRRLSDSDRPAFIFVKRI